MSLLLPNQLRIGICADRLICAGQRRTLRSRTEKNEIIPLDASRGPAGWAAALEALPQAVAAYQPGRTEVTLVLSNVFLRYALLPWSRGLNKAADWLALARHRLEHIHGGAVAEWTIRVAETGREGPRIASAVDTALLDALKPAVEAGGGTLVSVQPHLMAVFNRIRPAIGRSSCWLVIQESAQLMLALIQDGAWRAVRSRRAGDRWRLTLPEIIARESAVLGLEEPVSRVVVHTAEAFNAGIYDALEVNDLTQAAGIRAEEREMAMVLT